MIYYSSSIRFSVVVGRFSLPATALCALLLPRRGVELRADGLELAYVVRVVIQVVPLDLDIADLDRLLPSLPVDVDHEVGGAGRGRLVFEAHQKREKLLRSASHQVRQLGDRNRGVQLEVLLQHRKLVLLLDLREEHLELKLVGLAADVGGWVAVVRQGGRDELWASVGEELVEDRELAPRHLGQLLRVLLPQVRLHVLLQGLGSGWAQSDRQGEQGVHLLHLLQDLVVATAPTVVLLDPRDEHQALVEHLDGVEVPSHHEVAESGVVARADVAQGYLGVKPGLVVQVQRLHRLETSAVVAQNAVHPEKSNPRKVPQNLQAVAPPSVPGIHVPLGLRQCLSSIPLQLRHNVTLVHERLQVVQHSKRGPHLSALLQSLNLLRRPLVQLGSVLAKALELIDEFINHLPQPSIRQLHVHVPVQDDPKQRAVGFPTLDPLVQARR
mmetsp:Transcript_5085/g.15267  ORF Transcript_5085/g.15267 Transcript_5085/m.15267 type:complete len:441 (-) Transcript_5085:358-1680(-)